jgi:hypothetical protein
MNRPQMMIPKVLLGQRSIWWSQALEYSAAQLDSESALRISARAGSSTARSPTDYLYEFAMAGQGV